MFSYNYYCIHFWKAPKSLNSTGGIQYTLSQNINFFCVLHIHFANGQSVSFHKQIKLTPFFVLVNIKNRFHRSGHHIRMKLGRAVCLDQLCPDCSGRSIGNKQLKALGVTVMFCCFMIALMFFWEQTYIFSMFISIDWIHNSIIQPLNKLCLLECPSSEINVGCCKSAGWDDLIAASSTTRVEHCSSCFS